MTGFLDVALEAVKNPIFGGVIAAGLTGGAMFALRSVGPWVARFFREQLCTSLVVYNDEAFYYKLKVFLSKHKYSTQARSTSVTEWFSHKDDNWKWGLSPGSGWHFFWHEGNFYAAYRHIDAQPAQGSSYDGWGPKRGESYTIYTLGWSQKPIRKLLQLSHVILDEEDCVPVYIWSGHTFELAQHREKRSLDTIFIPANQKKRLVDDIERFTKSRDEYRRRGTPYRRGYMLYGPPGTGKSSLIFALASHFNKPVYIVNPATLQDDNVLQRCFNEVKGNGVLLIEDIDSIEVTEQRKPKTETPPTSSSAPAIAEHKQGITLSGLLNGIDGVIARDGRLLFITTNHASNLDDALIRPGRIDMKEYLGNMALPEAMEMFRCFHPTADPTVFENWIKPQLPMSPAQMQNLLLAYDESHHVSKAA